jgi:nucleotide-binding universal stress UspA family protein
VAAREAATRGGAVQAVIAWSWDGTEYGPIAAGGPDEEVEKARRVLEREVAALTERRGSAFPIAREVIEGRPADVLAGAARGADLLVLGSHGHSRVRHTVLGSVSEDCIRKAACPVVVVPVPDRQAQRTTGSAVRG